jgi:hypothetical protein
MAPDSTLRGVLEAAQRQQEGEAVVGPESKEDVEARAQKEVVRQLALINRSVEELTTFLLRPAHVAAPENDMRAAYYEHSIDYTDLRPDVEVTVDVLRVEDFNVHSQTFKASVRITLDWEEKEFVEGVHYFIDRSQQPKLAEILIEDPNSFNPEVCIDNLIEPDTDVTVSVSPKRHIHRLVQRCSGEKKGQASFYSEDGSFTRTLRPLDKAVSKVETVWITKEYQFSGCFQCRRTDAKQFPFDMHRLPIDVKSLPLPGLSTLNEPLQVRLVDPQLRPLEESQKRALQLMALRRTVQLQPLRLDETTESLVEVDGLPLHHWNQVSKNRLGNLDGEQPIDLTIGEMCVCAFGGRRGMCKQGNEYHVEVVLARNWTKYFMYPFLPVLMLVAIAALSGFVPLYPDVLANRLSITLAVVLTIVICATERPAAIERVCYGTTQDFFLKFMVFSSLLVALQNLLVSAHCWGMFRYGLGDGDMPPGSWFENGDECKVLPPDQSIFNTYEIDDHSIIIFLTGEMVFFVGLLAKAVIYRVRFMVQAQREMNIDFSSSKLTGISTKRVGVTPGPPRLMVPVYSEGDCHTPPGLQFVRRFADNTLVASLASSTQCGVRIFPCFWLWLARGTNFRECCCRQRRDKVFPEPISEQEGKHAGARATIVHLITRGNTQKLGDGRRQSYSEADLGEWADPYWGKLPYIDASDTTIIIDLGTGEVGFWELRQDRLEHIRSTLVFMTGKKHSYGAGKSFSDAFVQAEDGASRFISLLMEQIRESQSRTPHVDDHALTRSRTQSAHSNTSVKNLGSRRNLRTKILLGQTGANRQRFGSDEKFFREVLCWVEMLKKELEQHNYPADIIPFVPTGTDEANLELIATEWLVQHGDLDVMNIQQGSHKESFAGFELNQAFMRARRQGVANSLVPSASMMGMDDFIREFKDLVDTDVTSEFLSYKFLEAAALSSVEQSCSDFATLCDVFRRSPKLMRSLVKNRLFNGTMSAGGGSCQISMKSGEARAAEDDRPALSRTTSRRRQNEMLSLPLGNKYPTTAKQKDGVLWPTNERITMEKVNEWRSRIQQKFCEMQQDPDFPEHMDGGLRGLFIGISGVFYAAKLANCAEVILPKNAFLERIQTRLEELVKDPPKPRAQEGPGQELELIWDHLGVSNLTLVHEFVGKVLHESAWIVCKRNWKAQPASLELLDGQGGLPVVNEDEAPDSATGFNKQELPTYVAGWVLGFYLSQGDLL